MNYTIYKHSLSNELRTDDLELIVNCFKRRNENLLQLAHLISEIKKSESPSQSEEARIFIYQVCQFENFRKSQEDFLLKRYSGFHVIDAQMRR